MKYVCDKHYMNGTEEYTITVLPIHKCHCGKIGTHAIPGQNKQLIDDVTNSIKEFKSKNKHLDTNW